MNLPTKKSSLATLISVFFFWGFVAASNTILIGIFKNNFLLSQFQSQLVDLAFYIAYFAGSLIYFIVSVVQGDPLNKIGYKKGLIVGLIISAAGALLFVPATFIQSFPLFLSALFVVGLGFCLLQIVANPFVIAIGNPATGSHRINLAGSINSLGTTMGPLVMGYAVFGNIHDTGIADVGIDTVKMPYVILAVIFLLYALFLSFSNLPAITNTEKLEKNLGALKYPQLIIGMIAIFIYVGVEVSIQSNLVALIELPEIKGLDNSHSVHFISLYWGCLMIGRWTGSIAVFDLTKRMKNILTVLVPITAYGVILGLNYINGSPMMDLLYFFPFILLLIAGFFITQEKPAKTMMLFSTMAAIMMIVGLVTTGNVALYSFISGGLFCSIMWPCIFSLSIAGLEKYANQGSALLVMMILGGALIPPLQGILSDHIGIHASYIIPLCCFAYLTFYGWKVKRILKSQGINYDATVNNAH